MNDSIRVGNRWLYVLFFYWLTSGDLHAQVITGKVQDAKTLKPLHFANVFLNATTLSAMTDANGEFILNNIRQPGLYDLVASLGGYTDVKLSVSVTINEEVTANIKLIPLEKEILEGDTPVKRDAAWEKNLKKFEKVFLGNDDLADSCTIVNPWVIYFPEETILKKFIAKAHAPIEIDNKALGYKILFYLNIFWADDAGYFISGNVRFDEMQGADEAERLQWHIHRRSSYQHSVHHLFRSIIDRQVGDEGFHLYAEKPGFEKESARSNNFRTDLGKRVTAYDTSNMVMADEQADMYKITLKGRVEVHFVKEPSPEPVYNDLPHQVSWIKLKKDFVIVNKHGNEFSPENFIITGDMSTDRVARMLPLNYDPDKPLSEIDESVLLHFQEKIYVHTDKPYYYPGEPFWFKGYVNYRTPALRDSLSGTAYVEIINPKRRVTLLKTIKIDSGFFHGDFILPDTLVAGMYYLRAYTNFSKNFGEENLFLKPIPLLNLTDKVNPTQAKKDIVTNNLITLYTDKPVYKTRDKVTLTLKVTDRQEPLLSNFSISVTDEGQVVPVHEVLTITEVFPFEMGRTPTNLTFKYPLEFGASFTGRFLNNKGKPEKTVLDILQWHPHTMMIAEKDGQGLFTVDGLQFYDTAAFSFKSDKAKDAPYGKVELLKHRVPSLNFKESNLNLEILKTGAPQRLISVYEVPKGNRMLQDVVVKGKRMNVEEAKKFRPYGKGDYVIKSKDIKESYGNLLLSLQGRIPGLIIQQQNTEDGNRWVVYVARAATSSLQYQREVLVMVNDVAIGGNPGDILASINPATVESVEVSTRIRPTYGSLGGFGIVSIYTKTGLIDETDLKSAPNFQLLKIAGYARPRMFNYPDYSNPATDATRTDFRSLLYWNPVLRTNASTGTVAVTFFAADLPGRYRVVLEGLTQTGAPVRHEQFITVEDH